jgi:hypothetical protein
VTRDLINARIRSLCRLKSNISPWQEVPEATIRAAANGPLYSTTSSARASNMGGIVS